MLLGCYYYPWNTGQWLLRTRRRFDHPVLGQYDNTRYGEAVLEHMRTMRRVGIDFAAISWEPNSGHFDHVLDAAEDEGMKVTVFYESLIRCSGEHYMVVSEDHGKILEDMEVLAEYLEDDCWLRIGGKPVVMLYVTRNYRDPHSAFPAIREALGDGYLVGDEMFWDVLLKKDRIQHFDAVTSYNWYQPGRFDTATKKQICESFLGNIRECVADNLKVCKAAGVPYWPVAMPGYNDTGVRPAEKHIPIPRLDGQFFRDSLKDALSISPECLMITSYNESYEDTQIEPMRSYGDLYLDILRESIK